MNSDRIKRPMITRILAGTVLVGTFAFATQAQAQNQAGQTRPDRGGEGRGGIGGERPAPSQMVERRVARLTEQLQLTFGQGTLVREILLDEQTRMEALRPEGGPRRVAGDSAARGERRERPDSATRAQNRTQMEALRVRTDARIEGVLSSTQRTAYRELVAKRGDRPEGGRGGRGPGGEGRGRGGERPAAPPAK